MKRSLPLALVLMIAGFTDVGLGASELPTLPRYDFTVGRRLTYSGESLFKYKNKSGNRSFKTTESIEITAVGRNADGSARVIARSTSTEVQSREGEVAAGQPETDITYSQWDIRPDGGVVASQGKSSRARPLVLGKLPSSEAELAGSWTQVAPTGDATEVFNSNGPAKGSQSTFKSSSEGVQKKIYGMTFDRTYRFDLAKGMTISVEILWRQEYGFTGSGTGLYALQSDERLSPETLAAFAADATALLAAKKTMTEKIESIEARPGDSVAVVADLKSRLAAAKDKITTPEISKQFDEALSKIDEQVKSAVESGRQRAEIIGKPAYDLAATDLDGKPHKLSEYRGKVVVLDFWYRGCGWCIHAMPQVKQVADDFKDKPVVVIGLNTDSDPADAKFVVNALGLNYAVLQTDFDGAAKFHVSGFPSLLVLDKNGIVREFEEGYSPTLRVTLGKTVHALLDGGETN